jgi:hypothetical protein
VFATQSLYVEHVNDEHLTDNALDRDVGFKKSRFHEWLRLTGRPGGTQSTSGMSSQESLCIVYLPKLRFMAAVAGCNWPVNPVAEKCRCPNRHVS